MKELKQYETIKLNYIEEGILEVTLDRPQRLNALSLQMIDDLLDLWPTLRDDLKPG